MEAFVVDSPIGPLEIVGDDVCITEIKFSNEQPSKPRSLPKELAKCVDELADYFEGKLKQFTINVNPEGTAFQKQVWEKLISIPYAETSSYSALSIALDNPKAIRAVGTANGQNPIPIIIPCHRVIGKDGSLTGYAGGLDKKEWLLRHEGVIKDHQLDLF
ncbi:MAG: methylated-DNA--[protein]-cysteine S-methyltransferase [Bacteroidota bacterium]